MSASESISRGASDAPHPQHPPSTPSTTTHHTITSPVPRALSYEDPLSCVKVDKSGLNPYLDVQPAPPFSKASFLATLSSDTDTFARLAKVMGVSVSSSFKRRWMALYTAFINTKTFDVWFNARRAETATITQRVADETLLLLQPQGGYKCGCDPIDGQHITQSLPLSTSTTLSSSLTKSTPYHPSTSSKTASTPSPLQRLMNGLRISDVLVMLAHATHTSHRFTKVLTSSTVGTSIIELLNQATCQKCHHILPQQLNLLQGLPQIAQLYYVCKIHLSEIEDAVQRTLSTTSQAAQAKQGKEAAMDLSGGSSGTGIGHSSGSRSTHTEQSQSKDGWWKRWIKGSEPNRSSNSDAGSSTSATNGSTATSSSMHPSQAHEEKNMSLARVWQETPSPLAPHTPSVNRFTDEADRQLKLLQRHHQHGHQIDNKLGGMKSRGGADYGSVEGPGQWDHGQILPTDQLSQLRALQQRKLAQSLASPQTQAGQRHGNMRIPHEQQLTQDKEVNCTENAHMTYDSAGGESTRRKSKMGGVVVDRAEVLDHVVAYGVSVDLQIVDNHFDSHKTKGTE